MARKSKPAARAWDPPGILQRQVLFFLGKGGVGKTTAACSAAVTLLDRANSGDRIYLFSTDPAHSLADSLGKPVGQRAREVAYNRGARLYACEMDPASAFADFKERYGGIVAEILEHGTFLDKREIDDFLGLTLPGMDEVMALFQLSDTIEAGEYTHIVVDTAPAGHTWRLLDLPEFFANWVNALDSLEDKHRFMVRQLTGRLHRDRITEVLTGFSSNLERLKNLIRDPARSGFVLVTNPEPIVRVETARYVDFLKERQIPIASVIINRVEPGIKNCRYCRARAAAQAPVVKGLRSSFAKLRPVSVPLFPSEVRGLGPLGAFGRLAWGKEIAPSALKNRDSESVLPRTARRSPQGISRFELQDRQLLIFGGKGGVGKTTAAASAAISMARKFPDSRVLVLSTDPAHSLSDSFEEQVGELRRGIAGLANLDGMEIDSAARFAAFRKRYESWVDELFASLTRGSKWTIEFDREATGRLLVMAPPGIDEMLALATIAGILDDHYYSTIVVDTAPSGHLLRLLELPDVALSWVRALLKLMLEYKQIIHWGDLARELVSLSKSIKHTLSLLRDSSRTEFVGVAVPEKMSLEETARLYERLFELKIPVSRLLVNKVIPLGPNRRCAFCYARRREQDKILRSYRDRFRNIRVFVAHQQPSPVQGPRMLRLHFAGWSSITDAKS
jgi:arsenite-transporting ATPase